jgi:hypothetical protein
MNQVFVALSPALSSAKREKLLVSKERNKRQDEQSGWHGFVFLQIERCEKYHSIARLSNRQNVVCFPP